MLTIKVKKLNMDAKLPHKAHKTDAGFDLFSIESQEIKSGETKLIKTGISIQLPANTEAQIRPRSGLAIKHSITVLNSPGTIDEEYRGEIGVILINHGKETFSVEKHMKIAQMVVMPVLSVDVIEQEGELSNTDRGKGGFGSTGY
ncbi:dUTP diphosphatase [uncultured Rossellomorea sp.]|uniref:dUTP diphosphatase n=1 Tax=uncultured Rossellomorea sp. TaxID=2837549 RepID=UPI00262460D4|nr:dUTP diphosphatase [uncultured Rossellomorea sp.]